MAKWAIHPARGGAMRVTYRASAKMPPQVWHEAARGSTSAHELARWLIRKGEVRLGM
jgi:hypothetical protein